MPRVVDKKAKRKLIFDTAINLFAQKGYDYTTIDDIAATAGIGKGTVYEYYTSKEDFIKEAYKIYSKPDFEVIKILANLKLSPLEKLKQISTYTLKELQKEEAISRVIMNMWLEGSATKIHSRINIPKVYKDYRRIVRYLLKSAIKKGEVRADINKNVDVVLIGMLEGISLQMMAEPSIGTPEEIGIAVIDTVVNGIRTNTLPL